MNMEFFECIFCQKKYRLDLFNVFCPECKEPLLYHYPEKKRNFSLNRTNPLEKFLDFLPLSNVNQRLCLGEGDTSLIKLNSIMEKYNLPKIFAKNEISNPTGSFKDRGTAVAIQIAVSMGIERIGTVSTGNMAASTAAYGARAGLNTFVLVKRDTSLEKLFSTAIHNPVLVKVQGDYGKLFYESFPLGRRHNIYFMNSVDPFRIEGYKVIGFEIFLQLNKQAPRFIFVPLSSGGHLTGLMKAYLNLRQQGFIKQFPTFVGVQAQGCSPIAQAYTAGKSKVKRIEKPETIAHSISNPDPPGGNIVLKFIQENKGMIIDVSDKEILEAQKILAELEGIFCLPASATTLAGLLKFSKKMKFEPQDRIILIITGSGLKSIRSLESLKTDIHQTTLPNLNETIASILN